MYSSINTISSLIRQIQTTTAIVVINGYTIGTIFTWAPNESGVHNNTNQFNQLSSSMTSDGQYIFFSGGSGNSLSAISTNAGVSWQPFINLYWNMNTIYTNEFGWFTYPSVRQISDDKQVMWIHNYGRSQAYLTTNNGTTWTLRSTSSNMVGTAMNSTGQYLYYTSGGSPTLSLFRSSDYGTTWIQQCGPTTNLSNGFTGNRQYNILHVGVSPSGMTVVAADVNLSTYTTSTGIWISTNYGSTYVNCNTSVTGLNNSQTGINVPNDTGVFYMVAAFNRYRSDNFGVTITAISGSVSGSIKPGITNPLTIMNTAGATGGIFYSTDGGNTVTNYTWGNGTMLINTLVPDATNSSCVVMCTNYNNQGNQNFYPIIKLTNFTNITYLGPGRPDINGAPGYGLGCNNVSMSSDGKYIFIGEGTRTKYLFLSSDSGSSWMVLNLNRPSGGWPLATSPGISPSLTYTWNNTSMSSTGQVMVACSQANNAYVFLSINFGTFFSKISGPGNTTGLPTSITNTWSSSMSGDGTVILVIASGLSAYVSTNSGTSFTTLGTGNGLHAATAAWNFCAVGYTDPNYMLLSYTTGALFLSTNKGTNWTKIDGTGNVRGLSTVATNSYTSLSISSTGQYMLIVQTSTALYYSSNYGANWTRLGGTGNTLGLPTTATSNFAWGSLSGDGTKILTGVVNGFGYLSTNNGTSFSTINSATNTNGMLKLASIGWGQLIISNNGNVFYASTSVMLFCYDGLALYWYQANYNGVTGPVGLGPLQCYPTGLTYNVVKYSGNGSIVIAAMSSSNYLSLLSLSFDGGYLFRVVYGGGNLGLLGNTASLWTMGCISFTGQYMIIGYTNGVFLTKNYGLIWICIAGNYVTGNTISALPTAGALSWTSCCMSSTGTVSLLAVGAGALYLSTNSFTSYSIISGPTSQFTSNGLPLTVQNWNKLECSYDGSIILASINSGALYLSINTGTNWTAIGGATNTRGLPATATPWSELAISKTLGTYMLASANAGGLYLSTNTGTSFTRLDGPSNVNGMPTTATSTWAGCVTSDDGIVMAAAVINGRYYYSTNSGTSWSIYTYPQKTSTQSLPWNSLSMTADGRKTFVTLTGADYFIITL